MISFSLWTVLHGELGDDHIRGKGVLSLLSPEHLLQERDGLLGHGQLPVVQGGQIPALHVERDGDESGSYADIGVLHVPLVRGVEHSVPLVEEPVLPVGHGVETALVHIGELWHWVGFSGEEEALLLFLIKEGIDTDDPHLPVNANVPTGAASQPLRLDLRRKGHRDLVLVDAEGEENVFADRYGLVQVVVLVLLPVLADGEDAHIAGAGQQRVGVGPIEGCLHLGELHVHGVFGGGLFWLGPLRQYGAEALECDLVQILNHERWLLPYGTDGVIIPFGIENGK